MLPTNIGAALDFSKGRGHKEAVLGCIEHPGDTEGNLARLGTFHRIKMTFSSPVWVNRSRRRAAPESAEHTFFALFKGSKSGRLCYATHRSPTGTLSGFHFRPGDLDKLVAYELVEDGARQARGFPSLVRFRRRFDPRFATDEEVRRLYNQNSGQHGGRYRPNDFRRLHEKGLVAVDKFMRHFRGVGATEPSEGYVRDKGGNFSLTVRELSWHPAGRDITVSHKLGLGYVWYSSEFHRCGNGRYGLLVTPKTFLWTEDD